MAACSKAPAVPARPDWGGPGERLLRRRIDGERGRPGRRRCTRVAPRRGRRAGPSRGYTVTAPVTGPPSRRTSGPGSGGAGDGAAVASGRGLPMRSPLRNRPPPHHRLHRAPLDLRGLVLLRARPASARSRAGSPRSRSGRRGSGWRWSWPARCATSTPTRPTPSSSATTPTCPFYTEAERRVVELTAQVKRRVGAPDELAWVAEIERATRRARPDLPASGSSRRCCADQAADVMEEHGQAQVAGHADPGADRPAGRPLRDLHRRHPGPGPRGAAGRLPLDHLLPGRGAAAGGRDRPLHLPLGGAPGGPARRGGGPAGGRRPRRPHRGRQPRRVRRPGAPVQRHGPARSRTTRSGWCRARSWRGSGGWPPAWPTRSTTRWPSSSATPGCCGARPRAQLARGPADHRGRVAAGPGDRGGAPRPVAPAGHGARAGRPEGALRRGGRPARRDRAGWPGPRSR